MAQFDLFPTPVTAARAAYPFVLILQSDITAGDGDRIVAPVIDRSRLGPLAGRLTPVVGIDGRDHVVLIPALTGMPRHALLQPLRSLAEHRVELLAAVEFFFFGI